MEHKNLGDKTLLLFMLKRSGFFLFSCIIIFLVISFSGMLPDAFSRYVNFADFGLVVFLVITAGVTALTAYLEYRNYTVSVLEKNVKLTRGILNRFEVGIPYRHIKRVDIIRTIACQMLGVSNIIITTTGDDDEDVHGDKIILPYIVKSLAEQIQQEILQHAQVEQMRMVTVSPPPETLKS